MWREREWRGADAEYKLYEQFCNRAERPNCPAPSTRRMRSREMARSQFWTAWTSERWGTLKCLWDRYISFTPLIPTYVLSFLGRSICVVVQKYLRFQPATSIFQFKLLWACYPVAYVLKSVPLLWVSSTDYLLHMFSISPPLFLSPLQMQGDILWNLRDQMSRLGAHDDCHHQKISTCLPASLNVCLVKKMN